MPISQPSVVLSQNPLGSEGDLSSGSQSWPYGQDPWQLSFLLLPTLEKNRHLTETCFNFSLGYSGKSCECDEEGLGGITALDEKCKSDSNEPICSGNGRCKCGQCICDQGHVGKYCKCNKEQCPKTGTKICNGHGICDTCSEQLIPGCTCDQGWSGLNCECNEDQSTCRDPRSNTVCFNQGILPRIKTNQNKWKSMTFFYCFTSKA